jgi:hypothetical protein
LKRTSGISLISGSWSKNGKLTLSDFRQRN